MAPPAESTPLPPTYQVGLFALVHRQDTLLLVRPHELLLPGGPQSLPGLLLGAVSSGLGTAENALRRTLLSQVGISVGDLVLVGSHVTRAGPEATYARLNLIFGTEYCSGILNPQPDVLRTALWIPRAQLAEHVPHWLRAAMEALPGPAAARAELVPAAGGLSLFGRRRGPDPEK
ncbi:hypothetical protein [uncultured Deinococcus sp.]|uniref:hypothetical protein n=1 Tax=uncultured Deinococcus sp. TaxID=158789 RepID=UPI0025837402|nr:hypothetical protein [uncultured Deinococcus sp.]